MVLSTLVKNISENTKLFFVQIPSLHRQHILKDRITSSNHIKEENNVQNFLISWLIRFILQIRHSGVHQCVSAKQHCEQSTVAGLSNSFSYSCRTLLKPRYRIRTICSLLRSATECGGILGSKRNPLFLLLYFISVKQSPSLLEQRWGFFAFFFWSSVASLSTGGGLSLPLLMSMMAVEIAERN